ncbi:hypothetical protein [Acinetobacter puyangensis]|uniref:hypothetical protein n=1 Tax=Acinetobacter puyangensis TaxID=1096779 RepID=UPI003A4DC7C3
MATQYKFPRKGTHKAQLLSKLLSGEIIRNSKAKDDLDTPNPATAMSQLRLEDHWDDIIVRDTENAKASTGQEVIIKRYYIKRDDILVLKDNPRVKDFLKQNRPS